MAERRPAATRAIPAVRAKNPAVQELSLCRWPSTSIMHGQSAAAPRHIVVPPRRTPSRTPRQYAAPPAGGRKLAERMPVGSLAGGCARRNPQEKSDARIGAVDAPHEDEARRLRGDLTDDTSGSRVPTLLDRCIECIARPQRRPPRRPPLPFRQPSTTNALMTDLPAAAPTGTAQAPTATAQSPSCGASSHPRAPCARVRRRPSRAAH
jgi:hypothetical protein